jgi:hypothetical protein
MEVKKTINGRYTKEARSEYMRKYYDNKDFAVICDVCGGKYKCLSGKKNHLLTKKHIAGKLVSKNERLKKCDDVVRDEILRKLCDEVETLKNLLTNKKNDNEDIFKPTENDDEVAEVIKEIIN